MFLLFILLVLVLEVIIILVRRVVCVGYGEVLGLFIFLRIVRVYYNVFVGRGNGVVGCDLVGGEVGVFVGVVSILGKGIFKGVCERWLVVFFVFGNLGIERKY